MTITLQSNIGIYPIHIMPLAGPLALKFLGGGRKWTPFASERTQEEEKEKTVFRGFLPSLKNKWSCRH